MRFFAVLLWPDSLCAPEVGILTAQLRFVEVLFHSVQTLQKSKNCVSVRVIKVSKGNHKEVNIATYINRMNKVSTPLKTNMKVFNDWISTTNTPAEVPLLNQWNIVFSDFFTTIFQVIVCIVIIFINMIEWCAIMLLQMNKRSWENAS